MPLLGNAAMLLSFAIVEDAVPEHDEWHTHEHLPERLSIPGFVRGTRWASSNGGQKYFVMYEVEQLATLQSGAYLERLNNPSPWTSRMMPNYRGMTRGFCAVSGSFGAGLGQTSLLIRIKPATGMESSLRSWLLDEVLPELPERRGLGSAHLFEGALTPHMTTEQRIRGADAGVDWALLVTGYDDAAVARLAHGDLSRSELGNRGGTAITDGLYRLQYMVNHGEVSA